MQIPKNKSITKRFKVYENIVCLNDGYLYQLEHCLKNRTKGIVKHDTPTTKKYYINGILVTKKDLKN